jgi:ribonucleoside-diphosphate reductase alpha chain
MPEPLKTPEMLSGIRIRQKTPDGAQSATHMHVVIVVDVKTRREVEVFAQVGKSGGLPASSLEATCRMVSLFLRIGGSLEAVKEQLEGIGSTHDNTVLTKEGVVTSLGDALGKAISRYLAARDKFGIDSILLGEVDFEKEEGCSST